jgi:hypothetical protein
MHGVLAAAAVPPGCCYSARALIALRHTSSVDRQTCGNTQATQECPGFVARRFESKLSGTLPPWTVTGHLLWNKPCCRADHAAQPVYGVSGRYLIK